MYAQIDLYTHTDSHVTSTLATRPTLTDARSQLTCHVIGVQLKEKVPCKCEYNIYHTVMNDECQNYFQKEFKYANDHINIMLMTHTILILW